MRFFPTASIWFLMLFNIRLKWAALSGAPPSL
jgi:hypothetical protein